MFSVAAAYPDGFVSAQAETWIETSSFASFSSSVMGFVSAQAETWIETPAAASAEEAKQVSSPLRRRRGLKLAGAGRCGAADGFVSAQAETWIETQAAG